MPMTLPEALRQAAGAPDAPLTPEARRTLTDALARYPYFALAGALLLRGQHDEADPAALRAMQARVAVLTADKDALASLAAAPGADPAAFYPPEPAPEPVSTVSAIDTFLDTYGNTSPEEEALLERMIFNPVPDYADILASEAPAPAAAADDPQDALIDAFLRKEHDEPAPAPTLPEAAPAAEAAPPADASLSESLARIFIGQGRYERALEIISDLAERSAGKNPFYADQARYLRKLVRLQQAANAKP
ncbi:MAG: hypothetical protein K2L74_02800 [Muribaculaceae bacterium]|nr:hypothetical protein [Muribaculaceae bacterium]